MLSRRKFLASVATTLPATSLLAATLKSTAEEADDENLPPRRDAMTQNGHNTFIPQTDNEWVLNDTYSDSQQLQHPYLYHIPTNRRLSLGHFHSPPEYKNEWRCNTHPCASWDGKYVVVDSPHDGNGRQLYLIDIRGLRG
jgi:hypothetical protein